MNTPLKIFAGIFIVSAVAAVISQGNSGGNWLGLDNKAQSLADNGEYEQSVAMSRLELKAAREGLGPDHPDMVTCLNNIALRYANHGDFANAEPLYLEALAIAGKVAAVPAGVRATLMDNLGVLYRQHDAPAKAEPMLKAALDLRVSALGPNHPEVVASLNNLATLYRNTGRGKEADEMQARADAIRAKTLR